jgi:EAL domain-containing protein (putative c-di-GMP-specific phosphodiesterase class I)
VIIQEIISIDTVAGFVLCAIRQDTLPSRDWVVLLKQSHMDPSMLSVGDILRASGSESGAHANIVQDALHTIRTHLGMDVAFLAEFSNQERIFRHIDSDLELPLKPGDTTPLDETYCQRVVDGRLPALIPDTSLVPAAAALPVTSEFGIGAYLTSPIRLADGDVYGTLCCLSFSPDPSLGERDMRLLNLFGDFIARQIDRSADARRTHEEKTQTIREVLAERSFSSVYQPIFDLSANKVAGFEALTRFSALPQRSPDVWFGEAASVGLSEELEIAAIAMALEGLAQLPPSAYLSLNVSHRTIINGAITKALANQPLERIVLEITEHDSVEDYAHLAHTLAPLRAAGLRLAVDDAGAGYSSFRHILILNPDVIKLDISIIRDIDTNTSRRALASALIGFAAETSCSVVAEGVETAAELGALRRLCVSHVQGYLTGRPAPIQQATVMGMPAGLFTATPAAAPPKRAARRRIATG